MAISRFNPDTLTHGEFYSRMFGRGAVSPLPLVMPEGKGEGDIDYAGRARRDLQGVGIPMGDDTPVDEWGDPLADAA